MIQTHKKSTSCILRDEMLQQNDDLIIFELPVIPFDTHSSYNVHISIYGILSRCLREAVLTNPWTNCRSDKLLDRKLEWLELISQCSEDITTSENITTSECTDSNMTNSTLIEPSEDVSIQNNSQTCVTMVKDLHDYFSSLEPTLSLGDEMMYIREKAERIRKKLTDFESPLIFKSLDHIKKDILCIFEQQKIKLPQ